MRTSALLLLLFPALGFAHGGGHGPVISGKGPNGGKLSSVILARHADLGEKAAAQGVAEWVKSKDGIEVILWNKDRSDRLNLKGEQLKWILLGKYLEKPEVVTGSSLKLKHKLKNVDAVELILPGLGASEEKHVAIVGVR